MSVIKKYSVSYLRCLVHKLTITPVAIPTVTCRKFSARKDADEQSTEFLSIMRTSLVSGVDSLKGSIMELMAKRMSEKDMHALASYWGKRLSDVHEENMAPKHTEYHQSNELVGDECSLSSASFDFPTSADTGPRISTSRHCYEINLFHPLLGEMVVDLGYKAIYRSNVRSLATAPVWKKQRILRPERAALIAQNKIRNNLASSIPGTITFFMDLSTGALGIVDGQHRVAALVSLAQKGYWDDNDRNILVEVFRTNSDEEISALFREINSAEPVRLIDLPGHETFEDEAAHHSQELGSTELDKEITTTDISHRDAEIVGMLNEATEALRALYPGMFKPSSRCRPPHVNIDVLRDDLYQAEIISRHTQRIRNADDLLNFLLSINEELGAVVTRDYQDSQKVELLPKSTQNAMKKAINFEFYLGLNKSWIYK